MTETLVRTGVRILLREEMPQDAVDCLPAEFKDALDDLPAEFSDVLSSIEEREARAGYERGEIVYVGWQAFADLDDDGREFRMGGSWSWERPIRVDDDPTSALLEIVNQERYHLADLLGDLRIGGMDITRWEFHAAPFVIELSPRLQARLAHSWRARPPRQPSRHDDFYER